MLTQKEQRDLLWNKMYEQLLKFRKTFGHTRVPSTYKDKTLAKWVSRQREKEALMPLERRRKLNAVGFSWHKDMQRLEEQQWEIKYQQLKLFFKEHGHHMVPSQVKKYHELRIWVDKQRQMEDKMPSQRKEKLNAIKFRWRKDIKADLNADWNRMYEKLVRFHRKHGHCRVSSHDEMNLELGRWVLRQRRNYHKLDKRKQKKLEQIGFSTSSVIEKEKRLKWLSMFSLLKKYKKEHGNCRVPSKYKENPELGRWVEVQRKEQDNMPEWRREKLNQLSFEWSRDIRDKKEKHWYEMYDRLESFYKRFGHSCVPEYWQEDPKLYIWITYLRKPKKPLPVEKVHLLKQVKFVWSPSVERPRKRNEAGRYMRET